MLLQNIIIASNFTGEPVKNSLEFLLRELEISHEINFAPYNQIFQQLLVPSSLFQTNSSGVNIVLFCLENLVETENLTDEILEKIQSNLFEMQKALKNASAFQVPLIVVVCPPSDKVVQNKSAFDFICRIETEFVKEMEKTANAWFFSANDFLHSYKVGKYDNPKANLLGRIPYTSEFFSALGAFLARKIYGLCREPYKVIVLDCDQTLWKGVVGEDGVDGIEFDEPHLALQKFMKAQSEAGMLLCLCSKNNEPDVWDVFQNRPEMMLKRENIVASRINWNFKSDNLRQLADELQLGLNSFIFVDDDPAVCAEVEANCPDVLTLRLPLETEQIETFLQHIWVFDKLKITNEDRERTKSYQQQIKRNRLQETSANWRDFLANLQLKCEIAPAVKEQIPRISQLSLRTNQFNSTTKRLSESDLVQILSQKNSHIWTVNLEDRFGDYGLVGAIIFEEKTESLEVDSLMLSCRALGRGIEYKMLAALGKSAIDSNCKLVNLQFASTAKNAPVQNFLEEIGGKFAENSDNQTVYRIPSENLAKLEFNPVQKKFVKTESKNGKTNNPAKNNGFSKRNAAIVNIVNNLNTAEQILSAVNKAEGNRAKVQSNLTAPRNETERLLRKIWQRTLNLTEIGVRDNFFKLGGDSIQAVSLFVDIEEEFGQHLPLTVLIESPTIEKMAQYLNRQKSVNQFKYLVPIKPEGNKTPLFCMHAAGGNVLFYRDLANELEAEQPIYGLQARGVADKSETAHERVEEMAIEYLKEIQTVQPFGPYKLCGSSFGGLVAFEVAYRLVEMGEEVSLLALFDTYAPGYPKKKQSSFPLENKFWGFLERFHRLREQISLIETPRQKVEFFGKQLQKISVRTKRKRVWKENQFQIEYAKSTGRELPTNLQRNHLAIQRAMETYAPSVYSGQITLFRAAIQPFDAIFEPTLGWENFTNQEIFIKEVAGSHGALTVYPYAKQLAKELLPFLKESQILPKVKRFVAA